MNSLSNVDLLMAILRTKGQAEIAVTGRSMEPTLEEHDLIKIIPREEYVPGDILVFVYKNNEILVHRLLKADTRYYCKGDNSFRLEDIRKEQILGKVETINGRAVPIWNEELITLSYAVNRSFRACGYDIDQTVKGMAYQEYITKVNSIQQHTTEDKLSSIISAIRYRTAAPVFKALAEHSYAVVKGEALSQMAYGRFGARNSGDIDILIPRSGVKSLESVLTENGFKTNKLTREDRLTALTGAHQTSPYTKHSPTGISTQIDINFDIFWGEYTGQRVSIEDFLSDTEEMIIYGCRVKVLTTEKSFVQMILHHYKDINSYFHYENGNPIRRERFMDVYKFWYRHAKDFTPEYLLLIAEKYKIRPYLFYMLYFTSVLFPNSELKKCVDLLQCEEGVFLLDCYGLSDNERKRWNVDFYTRMASDNIMELIKKDMTDYDIQKLRRSKKIFT